MSFFTPITHVITLDDDIHHITLRKLTHGERQEILVKTAKLANGDALVMGIATQGEILKKAIQAWEGPGFEGQPVTPENIDALPAQVADEITEKASAFLEGVSDEEKKESGE